MVLHAPNPTSGGVSLIGLGDTGSIDAFGRQRVSDPETTFDYQTQYDLGPLLWEDDTTNNGSIAHNANKVSADMTVTTTDTDKVIRQSRQYHRYQPGKSQLILMTFVMASGQSGTVQKVGYFDAENGIFLNEENGALSIVRRTFTSGAAVDNSVAQASWNLDAMDGTGPSGITLDITKSQILLIDLEWLGVGRVRVGFVIDGLICYVHEFLNANNLALVYMTTANLPVRYEIENTSAVAGSKTMSAICCSVISEGGFETQRGIPFCSTTGTTLTGVTTRVPILSIQPKTTFNSITNRGQIIPQRIQGYVEDTGALFEVVHNGSLTSASFSSVDANSIVEVDTSATAITGGQVIDAFYVPASSQGVNQSPGAQGLGVLSRLPLTLDIAGTTQTPLTITATRIGASGTANVACTAFWQELR